MKKYKYENGSVATIVSEKQTMIQDWNCDGQIYPIEGYWIEWENSKARDFVSDRDLELFFTEIR